MTEKHRSSSQEIGSPDSPDAGKNQNPDQLNRTLEEEKPTPSGSGHYPQAWNRPPGWLPSSHKQSGNEPVPTESIATTHDSSSGDSGIQPQLKADAEKQTQEAGSPKLEVEKNKGFPLMSLPREVRDIVISHSIDPTDLAGSIGSLVTNLRRGNRQLNAEILEHPLVKPHLAGLQKAQAVWARYESFLHALSQDGNEEAVLAMGGIFAKGKVLEILAPHFHYLFSSQRRQFLDLLKGVNESSERHFLLNRTYAKVTDFKNDVNPKGVKSL